MDRKQGRLEIEFTWTDDVRQFYPVSPVMFRRLLAARPMYLFLDQCILKSSRVHSEYVRTESKRAIMMARIAYQLLRGFRDCASLQFIKQFRSAFFLAVVWILNLDPIPGRLVCSSISRTRPLRDDAFEVQFANTLEQFTSFALDMIHISNRDRPRRISFRSRVFRSTDGSGRRSSPSKKSRSKA